MASIRFTLSSRIDPRGKSEILMRFSNGRHHTYRLKTRFFIRPERWDPVAERPIVRRLGTPDQKDLLEIRSGLEDLSNHLLGEFFAADEAIVDRVWMQDVIDRWWHPEKVDVSFFHVFEEFIQESRFSENRKEQYWVLYRMLERFEKVRGRAIMFQTIDADFIQAFEKFLREEHKLVDQRKYRSIYEGMDTKTRPRERSTNTIIGIMKKFRALLYSCQDKGIISQNPFRNYTIQTEVYGTPYFLTIEERNAIYRCNLRNHPALAVQRDIFIFQCLTGPRYGDLATFRKSDIVDGVLEYFPHKTQENGGIGLVRVPLTDTAMEIVKRYSWTRGKMLFPFISMDKYNDSLKMIFRAARIDRMVSVLNPRTRREEKHPLYELASSHLARRTFVGNLYRQVKDPNLISSMSGHAEGSKAFARYRAIDMDIKRDVIGLLDSPEDKL